MDIISQDNSTMVQMRERGMLRRRSTCHHQLCRKESFRQTIKPHMLVSSRRQMATSTQQRDLHHTLRRMVHNLLKGCRTTVDEQSEEEISSPPGFAAAQPANEDVLSVSNIIHSRKFVLDAIRNSMDRAVVSNFMCYIRAVRHLVYVRLASRRN